MSNNFKWEKVADAFHGIKDDKVLYKVEPENAHFIAKDENDQIIMQGDQIYSLINYCQENFMMKCNN